MAAAVSRMLAFVAGLALSTGPLAAQTIYPIDRAAILAGARFDLKVEFPAIEKEADLKITINGEDYSGQLGKAGQFVENEDGLNASSLVLRDVSIDKPGSYTVVASDGTRRSEVTWTVFATGPRLARNVILFIGDGMSMANRTAASANSMSAYTTGHKSSVNALGVYAARNKNNLEHPKVETIVELAKRKLDLAVGVVSDAEVQDATPAGMVAHTRRRADKPEITQMFLDDRVDVLMGGGAAYFSPKSTQGSKRKDDKNYLELYQQAGFKLVTTKDSLKAAAAEPSTMKLLGLFHPENMDGALDRHILHGTTVAKYPHQPDLVDMMRAAIEVLSRHPNGFVLMVEAALIDKYLHPLDWERSVYDTIMLDNAVRLAQSFAAKNNDTLILVTPDHTHGVSLVGTVDDDNPAPEMRDKVGVYDKAGYPNYPAADADGYPAKVDVSRRLAMFFADYPDYYETFRPKLDKTFNPAVQNEKKEYVANEEYKDMPGATLRQGNLPRSASDGVHSADDAVLTATGPGSERVHGFTDNTEVFQVMVNALGLGQVE